MKRNIPLLLFIVLSVFCRAQDHSDAERLSKLAYMERAELVNCDSTSGTTIEDRICLNKEFQYLDSILNVRYVNYLSTISDAKGRRRLERFHKKWIKNRRLQSDLASDGYRGNMVGIMYLYTMNAATRARIDEFNELLKVE